MKILDLKINGMMMIITIIAIIVCLGRLQGTTATQQSAGTSRKLCYKIVSRIKISRFRSI